MANKKNILIRAESNIFSYVGVVPEQKAEQKLRHIRDSYTTLRKKYENKMIVNTLSVKTCVHNPELYLK